MQKIEWNLFAQLFGKTLTSSTIRFLARNSDKHYQSDVGDAVGVANDQTIVQLRFRFGGDEIYSNSNSICQPMDFHCWEISSDYKQYRLQRYP